MKLLRFTTTSIEPALLTTKRLILRRPCMADYQSWAHLREQSADFLRPFEPLWSKNELSKTAYRQRLKQQDADIIAGRGLFWFLFSQNNPELLLGGVSISHIRYGAANSGTMGYWMGKPYAGQGYMGEAVRAISDEFLTCLGHNRLEAATVLNNERSQRLLISCGFQKEGIARSYLKINDQWRDHILFARLAADCSS